MTYLSKFQSLMSVRHCLGESGNQYGLTATGCRRLHEAGSTHFALSRRFSDVLRWPIGHKSSHGIGVMRTSYAGWPDMNLAMGCGYSMGAVAPQPPSASIQEGHSQCSPCCFDCCNQLFSNSHSWLSWKPSTTKLTRTRNNFYSSFFAPGTRSLLAGITDTLCVWIDTFVCISSYCTRTRPYYSQKEQRFLKVLSYGEWNFHIHTWYVFETVL